MNQPFQLPMPMYPIIPRPQVFQPGVPHIDFQPISFPKMLEMEQRMKKIKEQNKVNITKKEIVQLLTQDSYYRKLERWPLLIVDDTSLIRLNRFSDEMFQVSANYIHDSTSIKKFDIQKNINRSFPFLDELLLNFSGHLVACGGAVVKSIFKRQGQAHSDIDLFFYDLTIEEANKIRLDAIEFLINLRAEDSVSIHVKRSEYTTTLYITTEDDYYEYQFIHRIYPDISSIIGGFDLSICMVAYDGKQVHATPLGFWSINNQSIIIDTKRRSTSFEYRLQKYSMYGFKLIFPGISIKLVQDFNNKNSAQAQMINKMKDIAKQYGFDYDENWDDFTFVGDVQPECSSYNIQKKENILPYFKLINHGIDTPSYDRKSIEDRLLHKISDYSSLSSHPKCFPDINAQQLRSENLHSVSSILKIDIKKNIKDQLVNDADNPNLMIDDLVISKFHNRVEKVRTPFGHKHEGYNSIEDKNIDFHRLVKCFGKLTPKVIEIRGTDEYYEYRDIVVNKMMTNAEICMKKLIGIKWITHNPGRQWTSSINPIISDPREWYGKHYDPVITGIPSEIETTMRLLRLPRTESVWSTINNDVFNVICLHLLRKYADDAWKCIL